MWGVDGVEDICSTVLVVEWTVPHNLHTPRAAAANK
jgi:hypothetical protein